MHWFTREMDILEEQYEDGHLTREEYEDAVQDLEAEARECAEEAAHQTFNLTLEGMQR